MAYKLVKVDASNYSRFDDMIFYRAYGVRRTADSSLPSESSALPEQIENELQNPNLYIYAVEEDSLFVGWISLVYIPKVGKWQGHGHLYVDELWISPKHRGKGMAKALMKKGDELALELSAAGLRLYVNVINDVAHHLYDKCGYLEDGQAYFMEKPVK